MILSLLLSKSLSARAIHSAILSISATPMPLVVTAAVPRRTPLVTKGLLFSLGTVFLFAVMRTSSRRCSSSLPVTSLSARSSSITWLSVPPETSLQPRFTRPSARAFAFLTIFSPYALNSGLRASPKHTAFAAIICISGPP